MKKILSLLMCITMLFPQLQYTCDETEYIKMTGLRQAIHALLNKKEILKTSYVGVPSTDSLGNDEVYSLDNTAVLIKEKDKDFIILNITDVHVTDYDERALMAFDAFATIKRLASSVKPDLITLTGDLVCSDSTVYSIKRLTDFMESLGIPWAPVFGNHDGEGNCDLNYLADIMMKGSHCLFKKGDASMGVGNYIVNIAQKNSDGGLDVIDSLIMMDSHKTQVNAQQIEWYRRATDGVKAISNGKAETAVFFHIPLAQYQYAYDAAWDEENQLWRSGYGAAGELHEKVCCERDENEQPVDGGFFEAAKQCGTKNIFCGHEHVNNYSIVYEGIRLTYTLKVGRASGFRTGFNGGTVISINNDGLNKIIHKKVSLGVITDMLEVDAVK